MYGKIGFTLLSLGTIAMIGCERRERVNEQGEREVQVRPARPANEPRVGEPARPVVRATTTSAKAVSSIVEARCDREARCNNIGADEKFKSWEECRKDIAEKSSDKIGAPECPGGIDSYELSECLSEVRSEKCGNPLDTLERVAACNSADLCVDKGDMDDRRERKDTTDEK
jgi:hypothetical protein